MSVCQHFLSANSFSQRFPPNFDALNPNLKSVFQNSIQIGPGRPPKFVDFLNKRTPSGSQLAISRVQKTHAYVVDTPEQNGEIGSTLGGQESPEYRFGGPNFFQFLKEKRKNFAIFLDKRTPISH
jgi:hypothetical protein